MAKSYRRKYKKTTRRRTKKRKSKRIKKYIKAGMKQGQDQKQKPKKTINKKRESSLLPPASRPPIGPSGMIGSIAKSPAPKMPMQKLKKEQTRAERVNFNKTKVDTDDDPDL